jgi:hypothetical protein
LEVATLIVGLVSAAALVGSLLFLARQTRESVQQSLIANELAGARAKAQGFEVIDRVVAYFVDYPELRECFYEGAAPPDDPTNGTRVRAIAELMADALQSVYWQYEAKSVNALRFLDPALDIRVDLDDYTELILTSSPAVRSLVEGHPLQWPHLSTQLDAIGPATTTGS